MTMARYSGVVTDQAGNIIPNAKIEVRRETPGAPLAALKDGPDGLVALTNPFNAESDGTFFFHVVGGFYKIRAYTGASSSPTFEQIIRYEGIGELQGYDLDAILIGQRQQVRVATTANITISTALNNGDTLDGVTLATSDLVLVKNQTAKAENGVYVVGVSPARSAEFDTYNEHAGAMIAVVEGTAGAGSVWFCTANAGGILDTTAIDFTKVAVIAGPPGADGEPGPPGPATIAIGTTTTLDAGSSATVTNSGDDEDVVLNFGVPRGSGYGGTSTTSLSISTGSKTFTTQSGLAYVVGSRVRAASSSNWMEGICTAYSGSSLTINVDKVAGSGTFSAWNFSITGEPSPSGSVSGAVSSTDWQAAAANGITGAAIKFGNVIDLVDRIAAVPVIDLSGSDIAYIAQGTRSTTASFTGSNGLLQFAPANTQRVTYNPVTREERGFLYETNATTNLLLQSESFSTSPWAAGSNADAVLTAGAGVAPDGSTTATLFNDNSSVGIAGRLQTFTVPNDSKKYTVSFFVNAGTSNCCSCRAVLAGGSAIVQTELVINPRTGAAAWRPPTSGDAFLVENVGNGWFRCQLTLQNNSTGNTSLWIDLRPCFAATYNTTVDATATGTTYFWGAQIEDSTNVGGATSYIKTTSAQVTRSGDSFRIPLDTNWFNADQGVFLIEYTPVTVRNDATGTDVFFSVYDSGSGNTFMNLRSGALIGGVDLYVVKTGVLQVDSGNIAQVAGTRYRTAFRYKQNDFAFVVNGSVIDTDVVCDVPTVNNITFGGRNTFHRLLYYPTSLSNDQLQALTS